MKWPHLFGEPSEQWGFQGKSSTNSSKKQKTKLVLDTNVWVSAFLAKGPPSIVVQKTEDRRIQIFISLDILNEIHRVLQYEKIQRILKRSGREPSSIMATVVRLCSLIEVKSVVRAVKDPADNQVLACAKDASADFIISGDRHLLNLEQYENIIILTPSSFLETHR